MKYLICDPVLYNVQLDFELYSIYFSGLSPDIH